MQKTIFITGASSGLGKASAKLFQEKGWNVIATMRRPEEEKELNGLSSVTLVGLDVTDTIKSQETIAEILKSNSVDVVLNNAGYGLIGPLESFTAEQIQMQIQTNLMGVSLFQGKKKRDVHKCHQYFRLIGIPDLFYLQRQ